MVSAYSLLLFGGRGNLEIQHDRGACARGCRCFVSVTSHNLFAMSSGKLVLDGWAHFSAPARVGVLVRELRKELEALLASKVASPGLDLADSPVIEAILLLLRTNGI